MDVLLDKQMFIKVPIYSIKYIKKETFKLYVDNRIKEIFENLFWPKCESEMCPHISTKKTSSFYDCIKCKTSCQALSISFKKQKKTKTTDTICWRWYLVFCKKRRSRNYEKPSRFLKNFLRQSQSTVTEPGPKKYKITPYIV